MSSRQQEFGSRGRASLRVLAVAAFAIIAQSGCQEAAAPPELPPRAIQWEQISDSVTGENRVISGIVLAISDTQLAFEVGGTVVSVEVNFGDRVKRDQVLARLDPEPFELTVSDAAAGLAEVTALRESARADASRTTVLFEADVASKQELDRDIARRDSRESQVDAAQARLNLARRDQRRAVLRAPFDGAISVREVDRSVTVTAGQTVFEMDSGESGLRVEVQMPETLISRIGQGDEVVVTFPSVGAQELDVGDRSYGAVVAEVGTRAGLGNSFPVRADLLDPPEGLRPGMTAEVRFSMAREESELVELEGIVIPMAALLAETDNRFFVFVYDKQSSTVAKRAIRSGGVRDNHVAVLDGLEAGSIIATAGVSFLRDGQQVTLLDERLVRSSQ
jgi:multidrug efflux system membrane fusion protein